MMSALASASTSAFTVCPVALVASQVPLALYSTPGITRSLMRATSATSPSRLLTSTGSPSPMPRRAASSGWISTSSGPPLSA